MGFKLFINLVDRDSANNILFSLSYKVKYYSGKDS
jgi:hypothetical protein